MKHLVVISSGFVALALAVMAGILWYRNNYNTIDSFEACEKAGYAVQQSLPRTCTAGMKHFIEQN